MAEKLNVPNVVSVVGEDTSFGMTVFLQAVQDALGVLDDNVVYKDSVSVNIPSPRLRASSAQGQSFSVSGVNLASGDDYAVLVAEHKLLREEFNNMLTVLTRLVSQIKGN